MNCDNLLYACCVDVCCMLLKCFSNKEMANCPTAMSLQDSLNVSMLLKSMFSVQRIQIFDGYKAIQTQHLDVKF